MKGMSLTDAAANRAEIRTRLHARCIRTIEAAMTMFSRRFEAGSGSPTEFI
jgi:hypothetical protein